MLTRFKQNIKTYPRTAKAIGALYLGAIMGKAMGISTLRQVITVGSLVLVIAFVDAFSYIWFMSDSRRLAVLLETLAEFEGRVTKLYDDEDGQDIAEYAVMLAAILVIVVGTIHLIGSHTNNVFSAIGSQLQ